MRIIAGAWRGRNLQSPKDATVRPTADKVRGAIFNIIQHSGYPINEATRVLDGFCGSGALGLEALSRGAAFALFLDNNTSSLQLARNNAESFKAAPQCAFELRDLVRPQQWRAEPLDLVFLDPPYRKSLPGLALSILTEGGFIAQGAFAAVETATGEEFPLPSGWRALDRRSWGESAAHFLLFGT